MNDFAGRLAEHRLVVILRAHDTSRFVEAAAVLYDSGVRLLEAALTTPAAPAAITAIKRKLPVDAVVGAGSVRTVSDVDTAAGAGAAFVVTPTVNPAVLDRARELSLPIVAGALSPTEIDQAWQLGVAAVKVFPVAEAGGVGYIRAVRAPMPDVPLVPTGGVRLSDVDDYLTAGAIAVAVASPLIGDALDDGTLDELAGRARRFVEATR